MFRAFTDKDVARFLSHVEKTDSCWPWTGCRDDDDYGLFGLNGKTIGAHVFSFIIHSGQIPDGLVIRHTCDNPPCVNPEHLLSGTKRDNSLDMVVRHRCKATKLTDEQVLLVRLDLRPFLDIASDYGITEGDVGHIKHKRIWRHLEGKVSFGNKRCKLTDSEILDIFNDPRTQKEIALDHSIGRNAVWYIKNGVTHRHLTNKCKTTRGANMTYECVKDKLVTDCWRVEAIDEREGIAYATLFSGPDSQRRAQENADWKNSNHLALVRGR